MNEVPLELYAKTIDRRWRAESEVGRGEILTFSPYRRP